MYMCAYFNLPRGDSVTVQEGNVVASAWLDRKVVMMMSTSTQPSATGTVLRRQKDGSRQQIPCPQAIIDYNRHMGGVDRGDQLRGYYKCRVKSRKFYKYIFYFLLDMTMTNAFVLHQGWSPRPRPRDAVKTIKIFHLRLVHELIGDYCSRRRAGRGGSSIVPLPLRHFPVKVPPSEPNQRKRGRCAHCDVHHKRTDTQWFCRECDVWLCHTGHEDNDCFLSWHKRRVGQQ